MHQPRHQKRQPPHRAGGPQSRQAALHRRPGNSGGAKQNYERYIARAKDAARTGDTIEMENCYQHAEHWFRAMRGGA